MTSNPSPTVGPGTQAVFEHLAAIAASLSGHGVTSRLTRVGDTPVLTIKGPGGEGCATIAVDPYTQAGPGLQLECTCIWTSDPDASPQATAATIIGVLDVFRPVRDRQWTRPPCSAVASPAAVR
jgi:hypothetical protein